MDNPTRPLPPLSRLLPFEAAARLESFSRAADELGTTQAAVSKQIRQLEGFLGTALFERRNRAVFLTDEGRRLGQVVGAALSDIASEIALVRGHGAPSELVLHCQLCEAFYWLTPRLAGFRARHPEAEVRLVSALGPLTEAKARFDVAIQTSGRPAGTARLAFTAADEIFPVCSPALIEARSLPLAAADLAARPLLSHRVVPQDWMDWPDWFEAVGASVRTPDRLVLFDSFPLVIQAAVAGQGIALGWRRTVEAMLEEGRLIRPCEDAVERPTEISIYRGAGRVLHPLADALLSWLREELGGQAAPEPRAGARESSIR